MCGVVGIFSHKPVAQELYDSLIHLQHRGQDAAGIITYNKQFHLKKGVGFVRDIFQQSNMERLQGNWGIGHTRYPTVGGNDGGIEDAQPFMVNSPFGIAMAHNGNLTNYCALKEELETKDGRHCNSGCDVEVILNVFASALSKLDKNNEMFENICVTVNEVFSRVHGAYSVVVIIAGKGMVAFRDPHGIRPFVCGMRTNPDKTRDFIFTSENTMYTSLGFKPMGNVQPGEVIYINERGEMQSRILKKQAFTPCIFEYVYFARPDSMINNVSVYRSRLRMGQNLAKRWKEKYPDILPDVVVPIPFSSNTAALSMAGELGVRYSEGIYKNSFVGRTFIMPGQAIRKRSVLQKLSPQETELKDKNVMLLDDSIVRGTTSKEIVRLVKEAGAKKVYFVSACPPVKFPCFYGVDMPTKTELIAAQMTEDEIKNFIGADILLYQTIDDLVEAITRKGEHNITRPCMACLDGSYITGDVDKKMMDEMEKIRDSERGEEK
ncbi:MAG: amidophosphoribosyltransferase [Candidatus Magasanikbacteria bacterium]